MAVGLLVWACCAIGLERYRQARAIAGLVPDSAKPNVLFVTLDTIRKRELSVYGYGRPTATALEKLAKQGIVFRQAIAPSNWTLSTHASLFTGRMPHELGVDFDVPLDDRFPTLAETMRRAGYLTAGFAGNCGYCGPASGLDRGFAHYAAFPGKLSLIVHNTLVLPILNSLFFHVDSPTRTAADINADFLKWQAEHSSRPFFAFLNYYDAHFPYKLPEPDFDKFTKLPQSQRENYMELWRDQWEWSTTDPVERQFAIDRYDAIVAYTDHHFGKLLATLEERGIRDNTIIVVTNDHGEHFGEHNQWGHGGSSMYLELIESPLIISYRREIPENIQIDRPVSTIDLAKTVCDLAQVAPAQTFQGQSLRRMWKSPDDAVAENLPISSENKLTLPERSFFVRSLITNEFHYIHDAGENKEYLFRNVPGTAELDNLADSADCQRDLESFRQRFRETWQSDPQANLASCRTLERKPVSVSRTAHSCQCRCGPNLGGINAWRLLVGSCKSVVRSAICCTSDAGPELAKLK